MRSYKFNLITLLGATTVACAEYTCISTASSRDLGRNDVLGVTADGTLWHKTGFDNSPWMPRDRFHLISAHAKDCPAVLTTSSGELQILYVNVSGTNVIYQSWDGLDWSSPSAKPTNLGGDMEDVALIELNNGTLGLVGRTVKGTYAHAELKPQDALVSEVQWDDFGGNFIGKPALSSWGYGRADLVGIDADTGAIRHKYYWDYTWSEWEDFGGGPFIGNPVVTSWGPNRVDIWAIDSEGELNHFFWDGSQWRGWENLGGRFTDTPKVVHWAEGKIDIVGKNIDDEKLDLKSYDGYQWNPDPLGWYKLAGPYTSEPGLLSAYGINYIHVFGIDGENVLREQVWIEDRWMPSGDTAQDIGTLPDESDESQNDHQQVVMEFSEL